MVENPKYPHLEELSEEDIVILDRAFNNYVALFYDLIQRFHDPKIYAEKVIKMVKSAGNVAGVFTLAYTKNIPEGYQFRPRELNQKLAIDIENTMQEQYESLAKRVEISGSTKLLHSRYLREHILKKLEEMEVFIRLKTKDEILSYQITQPHADKENPKIYGERGGKLSSYIIADEGQKLKEVLKKPGSIGYLNKKLIKYDLVFKLFRFLMLAFLHAAKKDRKVLNMAIGVGTTFLLESSSTSCGWCAASASSVTIILVVRPSLGRPKSDLLRLARIFCASL